MRNWPTKPSCCLLFTSLLLAGHTVADQAILIGGGYDIQGSQGQIELNTKWAQEVLQATPLSVRTFFNDGDDPAADVHYLLRNDDAASSWLPLARVFGEASRERMRYRSHEIPDVDGSTARESLEPKLKLLLDQASAEETLLVYNGHGSPSLSTPDQVSLALWNNSAMTAAELHGLLRGNSKPFRFVFTQCYSGGFHRLAYADPASGNTLAEGPRCGFTAESAYHLAEGCSASIDGADYRDYTRYFFAALSGSERDGDIVDKDPDLNADGVTSLREAHLFTLEKALSTDLPRSTSEDYLSNWEPWFLKWLPGTRNLANNEYSRLFRDLAVHYNVVLDGRVARRLRDRLHSQQRETDALQAEQLRLLEAKDAIRQFLQNAATSRWPALLGPYTGAYQKMAENGELESISSWLSELPEYEELVELESATETLVASILDSERHATQMQKLLSMRHLANLKQQLYDYGTSQDIAQYESLLACEEATLE